MIQFDEGIPSLLQASFSQDGIKLNMPLLPISSIIFKGLLSIAPTQLSFLNISLVLNFQKDKLLSFNFTIYHILLSLCHTKFFNKISLCNFHYELYGLFEQW